MFEGRRCHSGSYVTICIPAVVDPAVIKNEVFTGKPRHVARDG